MDPKPPTFAQPGGSLDLVPRSRLEAADEAWEAMVAVVKDQLADARRTANTWMRRAVACGMALEGRAPDRPVVVVMRGEVKGWELDGLKAAFGPETAGLRFAILPEAMAALYGGDLEAAARRVAAEMVPGCPWDGMDAGERQRFEKIAAAAIGGASESQSGGA